MNTSSIAGKVTRTKIFEKVGYITVCVYSGHKKYEFIDVTSFSPDFVSQYIHEGDFVAISGKLHVNGKEQNYKLECIGENISLMNQNRDNSLVIESEDSFILPEPKCDAVFPWED